MLGPQASPPARAEPNQEDCSVPFKEMELLLIDGKKAGTPALPARWFLLTSPLDLIANARYGFTPTSTKLLVIPCTVILTLTSPVN